MYRKLAMVAAFCGLAWVAPQALAQVTVECVSQNYQYNECYAPLQAPQLVYQSSHSACIVNNTWGFNPATRRIWVAQGCSGVFSDPAGYHHGSSGTYDKGAHHYDDRGHGMGALLGAAILAAAVDGAVKSDDRKYSTSNAYHHTRNSGSWYTGCHGVGCLVDDPDADAPPEPSQGQPTFRSNDDAPPEPGQSEFSGG